MTKKNDTYNSASAFGSFSVEIEPKTSVETGMEAAGITVPKAEQPTEREQKGAAAGCKPGCTRKTYVLPYELIDKLAAIAAHTRQKEVGVVIDLLRKGIANYEYQYGPQITTLPKVSVIS
ncbi:MAG: hypothetical protein J5770_06610 [Bacteroidaceae bacterium]|nr:hypothetical protein [Bacteroidaceae bacterium]